MKLVLANVHSFSNGVCDRYSRAMVFNNDAVDCSNCLAFCMLRAYTLGMSRYGRLQLRRRGIWTGDNSFAALLIYL